jgi:hypothetical protein
VPSGEAIAEAMGVPVVGEPVFPERTPLWYYIRREAEMTTGGAELGPVGGEIVAEVIVDALRSEGGTIEKANLPDVSGGDFRIGDLLGRRWPTTSRSTATASARGSTVAHRPAHKSIRLWAIRTGVPYEWLRYGTQPPK